MPLGRQLILYLNPFALFKDAAHGPAWMRESALAYNRAMRWMLLPYARRWALIALCSLAGAVPAEALAAESSLFVIPAAASAVSACIAITVVVCTLTAYLLLGACGSRGKYPRSDTPLGWRRVAFIGVRTRLLRPLSRAARAGSAIRNKPRSRAAGLRHPVANR